ncbi:hypothetical protein DPEC_G00183550 [Dallia pectoralis]|uniref:Uncharacterized protein n=1 Tax=Dallia pectoralis TaxID=75939 RepID=A0ACC2GB22_DALPE|nr:hypothetical protein DPEC_G00183550 [Dallia pectoralis]
MGRGGGTHAHRAAKPTLALSARGKTSRSLCLSGSPRTRTAENQSDGDHLVLGVETVDGVSLRGSAACSAAAARSRKVNGRRRATNAFADEENRRCQTAARQTIISPPKGYVRPGEFPATLGVSQNARSRLEYIHVVEEAVDV